MSSRGGANSPCSDSISIARSRLRADRALGYAFVDFPVALEAKRAVAELDGQAMEGSGRVVFAKLIAPSPVPNACDSAKADLGELVHEGKVASGLDVPIAGAPTTIVPGRKRAASQELAATSGVAREAKRINASSDRDT